MNGSGWETVLMAIVSAPTALRRWEALDPDKPALTDDTVTLSRRQLAQRTNRLAREFAARGVTEGSFVTISMPNCCACIEAAIAALKLGATPQPVSSRLPKRELDAIVELADPSLVFGVEAGSYPDRVTLPAGFEAAATTSDAPLPDRTARHWKAPTSGGSTGRPKLIVAGTPAEVDDELQPFQFPVLIPRDGVALIPGPLYHNAPFTTGLQNLFHGNHVVIMGRFDALRTLELIDRHRVQYVLLVPTMMSRIWKLPAAQRERFDLSSLRVVYHMASHCPAWLKAAWIEWLGPERIFELYGGTEGQAITALDGVEWLQHRGSVGRCVSGEIRILDEDGNEAPPGEVGEIYMRPTSGAGSTYFYIGAQAKGRDGWETIGDIGWLDEDGYLYLADRRTDLIVRGGANIYPAEVEAAIDEYPAVQSCAVIGLPDEDLGQRVHAIVQTAGGVSESALARHLEERLAKYKIPGTYEFVSEPMRDDAGKTRRSALSEARTGSSAN